MDVVRGACYLGVLFFPNFVSCSLQLLWQEIFASGSFVVAYAGCLTFLPSPATISSAGNVLFALLTDWLPSICSCRQISNIAWTGSFAKGLAYHHLTMWTIGTSGLFPTKSCTHRESLNEEVIFPEQGKEKATPFLKMRRTWTTCILTPTYQFPIGQTLL